MPAAYIGSAVALGNLAMQASNSGGGSSSGVGQPAGSGFGGTSGGVNNSNPFAGLAGGLASALNPPQAQTSPGAYSPPSNIGEGYNYIPTGQGSTDTLLQQLLGSLGGIAGGQGSAASPGVGQINSAPVVQDYANASYGSGGASNDLFNALGPALQQLIGSAALNPQSENAQYQDLLTKTQNQANVQNAEEGLGSSPFGAGVTNQAVQNLNMAWPQFLLQQLTSGIGGLNTLAGVGTTASNLGTQAGQQRGMAETAPAQLYAAANQPIESLITGAAGPAQSYMTGAQQPNTLSNFVANQQATLVGNQNANAAAGISSGLASAMPWIGQGLSGLYNSLFPSSTPNSDNPSDYGSSSAYSSLDSLQASQDAMGGAVADSGF